MKVFVAGATGFIGRALVDALDIAGHEVIAGVRNPHAMSGRPRVIFDYVRDQDPARWLPRLAGIDAVINAVGIFRETRDATFGALHERGPIALFSACAQVGVRKVLQISALGADASAHSRFHLSKRHADEYLTSLPLKWVIVQPSLVFGAGGTSARLFTTFAVLPFIPIPGAGTMRVQPIYIDDLVTAIIRLLMTDLYDGSRVAAVGPEPITFREMLASLRRQMHLPPARFVSVPLPLVRIAARIGTYTGTLLNKEALEMLLRGNVAPPNCISEVLGRQPRAVDHFIPPSDARAFAGAAKLNWLLPLLRASVALVWIVTGIVSLGVYPVAASYALLAQVGVTGELASVMLYGAAVLDIAFGIGIYALRDRRWLWRAQILVIVIYSVIIALRLPELWLHPFGPLVKNIPLLATIVLLHELERK